MRHKFLNMQKQLIGLAFIAIVFHFIPAVEKQMLKQTAAIRLLKKKQSLKNLKSNRMISPSRLQRCRLKS